MSELNNIWNSGKGKLPDDKLMAYLEGELSAEEQHEVEQWLADEGMEADALEGLKALPASESKEMVIAINYQLRKKLNKKKRGRKQEVDNNWAWLAVLIVLLLCIAAYVVMHYSLKK